MRLRTQCIGNPPAGCQTLAVPLDSGEPFWREYINIFSHAEGTSNTGHCGFYPWHLSFCGHLQSRYIGFVLNDECADAVAVEVIGSSGLRRCSQFVCSIKLTYCLHHTKKIQQASKHCFPPNSDCFKHVAVQI